MINSVVVVLFSDQEQQGYQQNDKGADETTEINTNQGKTSGLQDSSSSLTVQ